MKERLQGLLTGLLLTAMLVALGCSSEDVASRRAANDPRNTGDAESSPAEKVADEPVARTEPRPAPAPAPAAKKSEPKAATKVADAQPPAPVAPVAVEQPRTVVEPPKPVADPPRPVVEAPRPVEQPRAAAPPVYVPTPTAPPPPPAPIASVERDRPVAPPPPPAPVTRQVTIPAGTLIPVRMIDGVDSKTDKVGQTFLASIDEAVVVNGEVVMVRNADVQVKLAQVKNTGQLTGKSELQLQLDEVTVAKKKYAVDSNVYQTQGQSQTATTVRNTGVGAGLGALIGGLAGGKKGAVIGAGVGGGAGVAAAVMAKGDQVKVPAETKLTFRLENPVEVTLVGPPVAPSPSTPANSVPSAPARR